MKKICSFLAAVVMTLSITTVNPLTGSALENEAKTVSETKQQLKVNQASTEIVTSQDLGGQTWLINEVNKQRAPKKVGVDLTFEDLSKITSINLANRGLTGEVPPEIKNLVSLQYLILFSNNLSGSIPAELGELTNLKELRLDYNQFTGTIPDGLGNIASIALQSNKLVGQIPLSLYEKRTGINEVNVSGNQVTLNSKHEEPSIYAPYTFVYTPDYGGQITAKRDYLSNLSTEMNFTPFLQGSSTFVDLKVKNMFESTLFPGHYVTITDTNNGGTLYEGELTSDVTIPLTNFTSRTHVLNIVLDKATENPHNQVIVVLDILPAAAADVTVRYVDETGMEIHEPQTISGGIGDYYELTPSKYELTIDNYELDVSKLPKSWGVFSTEPQTVTYVYEKVNGAPVTVKYVNQDGKELTSSDTLAGKLDSAYRTEAKEIAGYTLDESKLPRNASGRFESNPQAVTYVYNVVPAQVKAHDSTIYVGDKWEAKDNFDSAVDSFGVAVSFSDVQVEGSVNTMKAGIYPVTYRFAGESITIEVTVKEKAIPVVPIKPAQSDVESIAGAGQNSPNKPFTLKRTSAQSNDKTMTNKIKLPSTGDNKTGSLVYSLIGFFAVCVALSLLFRHKKQKRT
ncbi:cell wall surface anchor family protein [Listeria monocytogenes]|uniref:MucBP domain-containing protein n=1 Tax=Listeria monocytogenes TaxID=1639 RepID=UPI000A1D3CC9|nr:MucBP domain-containing protein [Listeria monocytogenes]ARM72387.1 cell wall surface anchor family protein [Listeria monocytogenes]